ncbi:sugar phosphate nucleotidyltransferase [Scatolibacter rhodanostii]|uniref:sugar phosphate nucleotidyltransferase n=1 Tax=Scatolibacter rhodanostii TaxID=2014781 RepID=UPI000C069964|nr:sugar phosphate nucleotidyltransferase [Scatolibacter rhodanostii]
METKPVLVVMAAGMGSRYGGLKQIDPVGENGELIIDYSIFDALKAGFKEIIFVIKREIEADFKEIIGNRIEKKMTVHYAYQELDDLPAGYTLPEGRTKPWGTCHAVLSARNLIRGPFAVINADDYYGAEGFKLVFNFLKQTPKESPKYPFVLIGYSIENTLTENGHVARGVCEVNEQGQLLDITEHTHIEKQDDGAVYTEDDGTTWTKLPKGTPVSMNLWGFTKEFIDESENRFVQFLDDALQDNPLKGEYFLPSVVSQLLSENKADVKVLTSSDKWYGVTYKEDKPVVMAAIEDKHKNGLYPKPLWRME